MTTGWYYHLDLVPIISGMAPCSRSQARRLIRSGAVEVDGVKIDEAHRSLVISEALLPFRCQVRIGKHRFRTLTVEPE